VIILLNYLVFVFKFYIFWAFLILLGRAFIKILFSITKQNKKFHKYKISDTSIAIFYPILGLAFLGNILFISHFLFPLGNKQLYFIALFAVFVNIKDINNIKIFTLNYIKILKFFIIPIILLFSSYDIAFHYDAGCYHLNHQNWLRTSNLIIGFVNVYWPFGIGSIYEYISSVLWFDETFILLHFLNLVFIIFFYNFCLEHIVKIKNTFLKFPIIFVIIFGFLDNFGLNGGRNGYFYIQGVTASDLAVGILFFVTSLILISRLREFKFDIIEFHIFTILSLFLIQIKLSAVFITFLLFIYLYKIFSVKTTKFKYFIKLIGPYVVLSLFWTIKTLLSTGCFIFPVDFTCMNFLNWYVAGSTKEFEIISTSYSKAYVLGESLIGWVELILNDSIRRTVIVNFLMSLFIIYFIKKIFFKTRTTQLKDRSIVNIFIFVNLIYFVLAGPTPRYGIGILMVIISSLGFNVQGWKYNLNYKYILYFIFLFTLVFTTKLDSYKSFNFSKEPAVYLPIVEYTTTYNQWLKPSSGDKCWINLYCTMSKNKIEISKGRVFNKAIKK